MAPPPVKPPKASKEAVEVRTALVLKTLERLDVTALANDEVLNALATVENYVLEGKDTP